MCAVGTTAERATAAIRAGVSGMCETSFMFEGRKVVGGVVPFERPTRGLGKIVQLFVSSIRPCLAAAEGVPTTQIALLVAVAEPGRPGRFEGLDATLLPTLQRELGATFHESSRVVAAGRIGGASLLAGAMNLLSPQAGYGAPRCCVVAGADTLLVGDVLTRLVKEDRLHGICDDGLVPGEGGAAVLVSGASRAWAPLACLGVGFGVEPSGHDPQAPLRGDGYKSAFSAAFHQAGCGWSSIDYRLTDLAGERVRFKEAALALARSMRVLKPRLDLWHPAECTGDLGAATLPSLLCVASAAARKRYAPGPGVMIHLAGEEGQRAAIVARASGG